MIRLLNIYLVNLNKVICNKHLWIKVKHCKINNNNILNNWNIKKLWSEIEIIGSAITYHRIQNLMIHIVLTIFCFNFIVKLHTTTWIWRYMLEFNLNTIIFQINFLLIFIFYHKMYIVDSELLIRNKPIDLT